MDWGISLALERLRNWKRSLLQHYSELTLNPNKIYYIMNSHLFYGGDIICFVLFKLNSSLLSPYYSEVENRDRARPNLMITQFSFLYNLISFIIILHHFGSQAWTSSNNIWSLSFWMCVQNSSCDTCTNSVAHIM